MDALRKAVEEQMQRFLEKPPGEVAWPPADVSYELQDAVQISTMDRYLWLVILAGLVSFVMAWGIGANDVANAFATAVGSGAIQLRWACIIAGVMELLGAILLGARVTSTVRKNIIRVELFDPNQPNGLLNGPELLVLGFFCALVAASGWLILATALALPVSTTHSIVGALVGVGICFGGGNAVVWITSGVGIARMRGVVGLIVAWLCSPLLSAIISLALFLIVRSLILRSENSVRRGFLFRPLFYGLAATLALFFIIFEGSDSFRFGKDLTVGECLGIALAGGTVAAAFTWFFLNPLLRKKLIRMEERKLQERQGFGAYDQSSKVMSILRKVGVHVNVDEELSDEILAMYDSVETFDEKTEHIFAWVQVFTASFDSFAHGANDTANAAAPFASIYSLYKMKGIMSLPTESPHFTADGFFRGGRLDEQPYSAKDIVPDGVTFCGSLDDVNFYRCLSEARFGFLRPFADARAETFSLYDVQGMFQGEAECYPKCSPGNSFSYTSIDARVEIWVLVIVAIGIFCGLVMWGYRVIIAIGEKLTKLTPSRGFAIEIGASITVLAASGLGFPVSTTHCQVGSTMGVGLAEFRGNTVNWRQFLYIFVGWGITLLFTGVVAGLLFSFAAYSPARYASVQSLNYCPGEQLFILQPEGQTFNGVVCSGMT
mmetsp:Transcript_8251/g.24795  ORF Transcript_8251/g.24795 Transcript_8251/m.24795 type:complete len:661 (-) Transcript_8251:954-2936(-)